MREFKVWCPDYEDESDAKMVIALLADYAATDYVEGRFDSLNHFDMSKSDDGIEVLVKSDSHSEPRKFKVHIAETRGFSFSAKELG